MEKQTLEQFIKSKFSALLYEDLPARMGITQTKFTRIMNRPEEASKQEVLDLAGLLKQDAQFLINEFKMGYNNITLDDFANIKKIA